MVFDMVRLLHISIPRLDKKGIYRKRHSDKSYMKNSKVDLKHNVLNLVYDAHITDTLAAFTFSQAFTKAS